LRKKRQAAQLPALRPLRRGISGLTLRILAVNTIAVMILGLGILYMGKYTDSLVSGELEAMRATARLFAGAVAESAVRPAFPVSPIPFEDPLAIESIRPELARRMVRRLGETGSSRVRLFAAEGGLLADSHQLTGPGGVVQVEHLTPDDPSMTFDSLFTVAATKFLTLIPMQTVLSTYPERDLSDAFIFPDTRAALSGVPAATAWARPGGGIVLTAAAPVQKVKQVMGVVLLIRDGSELERSIAEIRVQVFRVFLGSLGITVLLSIYLSGLIGRPLQRLAAAAEDVRLGKGRQTPIPDMSHRNDEIGELSVALREMTEALWARMDTIERFAADVAHEIKNPLTSLRSAVETASRVKDEVNRQKLMDIIQHDVRRLDRLISDISAASRLDAALSREEMREVDLAALLYALRDGYKKPLDRADSDNVGDSETPIKLEIPMDRKIAARGNADRLGQVFANLISNALSFSPDGGTVTVRATPKGGLIMIQVDDQGPGIPEGNFERIFERFYTQRPRHEGYGNNSGLGLSIARQIVTAHGGRIEAENILDETGAVRGARFTVTLKAA